jgi:hypothetical protein
MQIWHNWKNNRFETGTFLFRLVIKYVLCKQISFIFRLSSKTVK